MIYSYVYYVYAVSVQLTQCKGRKNIGIMQVHVGSFVRFPYFCVIILLLWVEKLQSKGAETVWKGFCILIRELIHPYESISISLCNLRSMSLNGGSTPLNVGSTSLNEEIIRMRKQIHCVRIICAYGMKDKFSK